MTFKRPQSHMNIFSMSFETICKTKFLSTILTFMSFFLLMLCQNMLTQITFLCKQFATIATFKILNTSMYDTYMFFHGANICKLSMTFVTRCTRSFPFPFLKILDNAMSLQFRGLTDGGRHGSRTGRGSISMQMICREEQGGHWTSRWKLQLCHLSRVASRGWVEHEVDTGLCGGASGGGEVTGHACWWVGGRGGVRDWSGQSERDVDKTRGYI